MPEGHTLHRLAGSLRHAFAGTAPAASSPQGRFVEGAALLDRRPFLDAQAWGKHLFCEYAGELTLHVHLGLIGSFDVHRYAAPEPDGSPEPDRSPESDWAPGSDRAAGSDAGADPVPPPVGAVRLRLVNAAYLADLRGATHVALATPEEVAAVLARLGPDPLHPVPPSDRAARSGGNDPERAWARISKSPRTIADLLMDQAVLAGVGNVYRSEVLFRLRVDPHRPGREIRRGTWQAIWDDLVLLLPLGVALGQIVTMADQVQDVLDAAYDPTLVPRAASGVSAWRPNPLPGALERRYYVYKRQGQPCLVCGSRVRTAQVAGRNLFWCGRCQRRR